jgi:CRP/FNR family cyclic AMP-dependent transcriptional regulator
MTNIQADDSTSIFLEQSHRHKYPAKSTILFTGDNADAIFYIIKGSVSVILEDDDGHEMVISYLNEGDFFGELGFFGEVDRSALIKAKIDCEVGEMSYSTFREVSKKHPQVLMALCTQMAKRLRDTTQKVGDLAFVDVTGRVASTLLDLSKQPDAVTHPDGMQIKVTRQEIARIVGCSREMAGRVLKTLEDQGLVSAKGKTMVIFGTRN